MSLVPFHQWFCLKAGRDNFAIMPERDQAFLFGKAEWRLEIDQRLQMSLLLKEPIRLVWWGQFGIGKTHRVQYMRHVIERDKLDFYPVYVVCRDLTTKSGFGALHYDLVNNLGFNFVRQCVKNYRRKLESNGPLLSFEQLSPVADVANAMERAGDANDQIAVAAWRLLTGREVKGPELALANVTKGSLDSSVEYAGVLNSLAHVVRQETGKHLLYLIDQVEALGNVTNRDFENSWVETLRAVLDVHDLGIVCTIGAERLDGIPAIMLRAEILSRFKQNNYLQIPAYAQETASDFLKDLLREWIDMEKRDRIVRDEHLEAVPGYDPTTYPFTQPAFDTFSRYITADPRNAKPREILERLNWVTAQACLHKQRLVTRDELIAQGISA